MVSRIFKKEIQDWWDNTVDRFISEKATCGIQSIAKVSGDIFYSKAMSDRY